MLPEIQRVVLQTHETPFWALCCKILLTNLQILLSVLVQALGFSKITFLINKWLHLHFFVRCWKNPYQNRVRFGPRFFNLVHGFWWRLCKIVSKIHVCYPRNHVLGHAEDVPDHKRLNFVHGFRLAFGDFSYWFFKLTSRPTYGFCTWAEKTWMKLDQNLMRNLVQLSSWWFWVCVLPSKSVVWDDLSVSGLRRPLRGWSSRLPNRMAETHLDYQQPCGRTFLILLPVSFWSCLLYTSPSPRD